MATPVRTLQADNQTQVSSIAVSNDGATIVAGGEGSAPNIRVWNLNSGEELHTLTGLKDSVLSVAISRDGQFAAATESFKLMILDVASGNQLGSIAPAVADQSNCVAFSPQDNLLLWGTLGQMSIFDTSLGRKNQFDTRISGTPRRMPMVFSPNGDLAALGYVRFDGGADIMVFDLLAGKQVFTATANRGNGTTCLDWTGNNFVSGSGGGNVTIHNPDNGAAIQSFAGHTRPVNSVALSTDGTAVLSGSDDGTMKLWNVGAGMEVQTFDHQDLVRGVAFTPDLRFAVSAGGPSIKVFDLAGLMH
jgi:WD40 repeat protein